MLRQARPSHGRHAAVICDVEGGLLRSFSCFPYFMAAALESGGLLRALFLLLVHPILSFLGEEMSIRAMTLITFCGVRVRDFRVGSTVLPKHLLSDVGKEGFQLVMTGKRKFCVSRMPKVMVEQFLRKYMRVDVVVAKEIKVAFGFYTGFMEEKAGDQDLFEKGLCGVCGDPSDDENGALGFSGESTGSLHPLFSHCQKVMVVSEAEKTAWRPLPPEEYPEPLIFHDGRLAFRPTPFAATAMFIWFPFGCILAILRIVMMCLLPFCFYPSALAFTGMKYRVVPSPSTPVSGRSDGPGRLFICNHRTQVDHNFISLILRVRVVSLVYGISIATRILTPLRLTLLKRVKEEDRKIIGAALRRGDVVVSPEGTTCREPFVLRFSPLFAEVVDEVHPIALSAYESMFYGTTVTGKKVLDPFLTLANPYPFFTAEFLETIAVEKDRPARETANRAQAAIAAALGFRSTMSTRKIKYEFLSG